MNETERLEEMIGFRVERPALEIDSMNPFDDRFSYRLCMRFYGKRNELRTAIHAANAAIVAQLRRPDSKRLADLYSIAGNLHYIDEDFRTAAGYFMKALSNTKGDLSPWIELLFCIRQMGDFRLFETALFNIRSIHALWMKDPENEFSQDKFHRLLESIR